MKDELKSFYAAVLLSLAVIFVCNFFFAGRKPAQQAVVEPQPAVSTENTAITKQSSAPQTANASVEEVLQSSPRIFLSNNSLQGSIRIAGNRIDNLWLKKYKQTLEPDSPDVELFAPAKTTNPYYAEFGWLSSDKNLKLPTADTIWTVKGQSLTPTTPLTLEWNNGQGLRFITQISIDEHYMFSINQSVENNTSSPITVYPYGLIARNNEQSARSGVVHEGMIGVFNDELEEIKYSDLKKEAKKFETTKAFGDFFCL